MINIPPYSSIRKSFHHSVIWGKDKGLLLTASFSPTVINAKVHALVDVTTMDTQNLVPNGSSKEYKNNLEKKIFLENI